MVLDESSARIEFPGGHRLDHLTELQRQARAARRTRRGPGAARTAISMTATGKPTEPRFDISLV